MHFYKLVRKALEEQYGLTANHDSYAYQAGYDGYISIESEVE